MSSETEEDRKEYVERDPAVATEPTIVTSTTPVVRERIVREPVATTTTAVETPASGRRESVVRRRSTNTGAIVAMIIGVLVLLLGIYLVFERVIPNLPYPWSTAVVLILGVIFIAVGASLVRNRSDL